LVSKCGSAGVSVKAEQAIDDAIAFVEASNQRISAMETGQEQG